jgi:hypothetical protein
MVRYANFDVKSAYNREAAVWAKDRCRSANSTHVCSDQLTHCLERRIGVDGFFLSK